MIMDAIPVPLVSIACGVLGLLVGSFLNVVIHRVPRGESLLRPPSHCPQCDRPIRARHNVPVLSWLVLRGRCADCSAPISARYPLVEATTGVSFAVLGATFAGSWMLVALLYLAAAGIALTMIDVDTHRLPDVIVLPSCVVVLALLTGESASTGSWSPLLRAVLGAAASWAFFRAVRLAWPGGMGGGDVKLAVLLGLMTGWLGWGVLAIGVFGGFLLGAVVGVAMMSAGRAGRRTALPFGPFLIIGAFFSVYAGAPLATAYLDLITRGAS
jgi:leader peptidase (prepilin peptidase)/N-methyltransferase